MNDATCEMFKVAIDRERYMLMCGNCGHITAEVGARFCPNCGAGVEAVQDEGDELRGGYSYALGFDEGYDEAMRETEADDE